MNPERTITALDPTGIAQRIRQAHELAAKAFSDALAHAKDAGELLCEAKTNLPHGSWLRWLRAEVGISPRTAQTYMRVARQWPELEAKAQRVAHLPLREGLKLLAGPGQRLRWQNETDPLTRVKAFEEWVESMLPAGWEADLALARRIVDDPDATLRQLVFARDLAAEYEVKTAEIRVRAERELGSLMNEIEKQHGKCVLHLMCEDPSGFADAVEKVAEERFGKGCLSSL